MTLLHNLIFLFLSSDIILMILELLEKFILFYELNINIILVILYSWGIKYLYYLVLIILLLFYVILNH